MRTPTVAALALLTALVANPALAKSGPATPMEQLQGAGGIAVVDAAGMKALCQRSLQRAKAQVKRMEANRSGRGFLAQWNELDAIVQSADAPASLFANVFQDAATRAAAERCSTELTAYSATLGQNEKLYANLQQVKPADAIDAQFKRLVAESFEDTGVTLPPPQRKRMKEILDKLEQLRQDFDRNVREDKTTVTMTAAEVQGMPEGWLKAQKPDGQGGYVVGLSYPAFQPYMQSGPSEAARKRLWMAKQNEGTAKNLAILNDIATLRHEMAQLFGQPSYRDYVTRRRMVGNSATVESFLVDVKNATLDAEKKEIAELVEAKAQHLGTPAAATSVNRWDYQFYSERLRKSRYNIDQEALRKHFPTQASVDFSLKLAETLYGVRFKRAKAATWHEDVQFYTVHEAKGDAQLGSIYLDLFPRPDKYNHAAAWGLRGSSGLLKRQPLSVLVTNFNREGLTHDELETMLHEFGHVLHGVLSQSRYTGLAGTSVKLDFVEAPSQMFEEWARRADTLALFQTVCASCPALSADQIKRLDDARRFGRAVRYARQHLYAAYDLALHGPKRQDPIALWAEMERAQPLGHVDGTMFPAGFSHLAGGYGSGYYSYLWSEVLALDMLSAYNGKLMDPAVGKRYRDIILQTGGQREPMTLVTELLGRAPNRDAFFAEIRGQR